MKRCLCLILSVLLLLGLFSGCAEQEPEPLRILVDLGMYGGSGTINGTQEVAMSSLVREIQALAENGAKNAPQEIEIEYLPYSDMGHNEERDSAIQRLRVEIMGGKGPDVFIMGYIPGLWADVLFQVPEKAMDSGLFLNLDPYIANARYMEWDKQLPQIMEAGRNGQGQLILPLTYSFPVTLFDAAQVTDTASKDITWQQMLQSEDHALFAAAAIFDEKAYAEFGGVTEPYLQNIVGRFADFQSGEILFSEDELRQRCDDLFGLLDASVLERVQNQAPAHYKSTLHMEFTHPESLYCPLEEERNGIDPREPLTMIPLYSDDGGLTAEVMSYAAININTKQPEQAFFVLDYLFGTQMQQSGAIYTLLSSEGVATHTELMSQALPTKYVIDGYALSDENFAELCEVRDQITYVAFRGNLVYELENLFYSCHFAREKGEAYDGYITDAYRVFDQTMSE